jgi:hypothetical protein
MLRSFFLFLAVAVGGLAASAGIASAAGAADTTGADDASSLLLSDDDACACNVTPAACDASCACDSECEVDWSADECAQPGAGCLPEAGTPDDAALEAEELAAPAEAEAVDWTVAPDAVECPEGAVNEDGRCIVDLAALEQELEGGCGAGGTSGVVLGALVLGLLIAARRRRGVLALGLAACAMGGGEWDDAVEAGPTGDREAFLDVYAAELGDGDGAQLLLASQPLAAGAQQPGALMSLSRARTSRPIFRAPAEGGDRLVTSGATELVGWARAEAGEGTAELVELQAPGGAYVYEMHAEAIEAFVADGYAITARLGYVWPPGLADAPLADDGTTTDEAAPTTAPATAAAAAPEATGGAALTVPVPVPVPCAGISKRSPLELLYASPGAEETLRFLKDCPGEVVVGEKKERGPRGSMRTAAAHAAGGRTGFVVDQHGWKLRDLLLRDNGVERTAAYLRDKLRNGYDYIVIDEITAAPEWRDGATANRRLRKLLLRLPARTVIPYISIDLTQYPDGFADMRARRLLLRAFKRRARVIALEIYLHTPQVMAGAAPATYRRAADRLALAVKGLPYGGGINTRAISVIGTSMHSTFPQYRYLDQPRNDLSSITRQVNAIRHGSKRLRQQRGLGYYFVNKSDMAPLAGAPYTYDGLIRRMRLQALRFR